MVDIEYIFGPHSVLAAIDSGKREIFEIFITENNKLLNEISHKSKKAGYKVTISKKDFLFNITKTKSHQGIAAKVSSLPLLDIHGFLNGNYNKSFIVILDSLEDPTNLGAIARSALCLGAGALVIPKHRTAGPTPAASKISAGALEYIPIICETNLSKTIQGLKDNGYWIGGLDAGGETFIEDAAVNAPFALVVGSEGKGIRPLVRRNCDFILQINQKGPVTSLNAGVAAAIGIYECVKKLQ